MLANEDKPKPKPDGPPVPMFRNASISNAIIGLGRTGTTITSWIKEKQIANVKIIAIDTDSNHLALQKGDKKILLGEQILKGEVCKNISECIDAVKEKLPEIRDNLEGSELVWTIVDLEDYIGASTTPFITKLAKEMGALSIAVVTFSSPVDAEKRGRIRDAIKQLSTKYRSVIIIDSSKLREQTRNLPMKEELEVLKEAVGSFVINIIESITQPSLVNLDYADLRALFETGGISTIGIGEGKGKKRMEKAIEQAISTPLLDLTDVSTGYNILFYITGGEDMTLDEVKEVGDFIFKKSPHIKRVVWGATVDKSLAGEVRVIVILIGVSSSLMQDD